MSTNDHTSHTDKDCLNEVDFGFLPTHLGFETQDWLIEPLTDYGDRVQTVKSHIAHDGFMYPPFTRRANTDGTLIDEPCVPGNLFKVPASHRIKRNDGANFECTLGAESFFITQCLGLLYKQRTTFEHWWLDKRIRFPQGTWGDAFYHVASNYLQVALSSWHRFNSEDRSAINSIINIHLRNESYKWDFERFSFSYSVTDGLFRVARNHGLITEDGSHRNRLHQLMTLTGAIYDEEKVRLIVKTRNDLIHEIKWDQGSPLSPTGYEGLQCSLWLPRLNDRLIVGLLGYQNKWVNSPWWTGGTFYFDKL